MKSFLHIIIMVSCILVFMSCDDSVSQGRRLYKAYFHYILKDPDSFKVYSERYTKDGDYSVNWILDYGAKNSLGGMVRETATFSTVTDDMISIDGRFYDKDDLK